uniref:Autophagy related 2A n=1 Tax=Moschus moschiferus TaxID=68415 RepID=A0A8C6EBI1_MOSMO
MSRWLWPWSNCVKERVCRYLLHHYLGHFFQEHLSLDQLSLDLYKGSVALRDIHLEIWSVNEVLESMESPLELVEGFVGSIEVAVPWAALLTDHCTVHVSGLQLTLQPRQGSGKSREKLRLGGRGGEQTVGVGLGTQDLTGPACPETPLPTYRARDRRLTELGLVHDHEHAAGSGVPAGRAA